MTGDVVVWGTDEFGASKILSGMRAELIEDPAVVINMEGHASMVLIVQKSGKVTFSGINSRYYDPVQFGCDNAINSWILFQDNNYWAACMIQNGNPGSTTYNLIEKSFAANGTPSRANFFRKALSHYMPSEIAMDDFRSPRSGVLLMIVPSNNK